MAELCALPGTGPSHGYIGQRPEICREASENIVTRAQVPLAQDVRMEHKDEQQSLDVSVLPAPSRSGRGQPDPQPLREPDPRPPRERRQRWEGNPRLLAAGASHLSSQPQLPLDKHPPCSGCVQRNGRQSMGQRPLSPPPLEMSIAQVGLHSLDLHTRRLSPDSSPYSCGHHLDPARLQELP